MEAVVVETLREVIEHLLDNEAVEYVYNEHYNVLLFFSPDGTVGVQDGEKEEYTWNPGDETGSGIGNYCQRVAIITSELKNLMPRIPFGNLAEMGGRSRVIDAFLLVEYARHYTDF